MIYDTLKTDTEMKRELLARTPEHWLEIILTFRGNLRTRVACLVWWDWYAIRNVTERWSNLDPFLAAPHIDCDHDDLKKALLICGYPETLATSRSMRQLFIPAHRRDDEMSA